MASPGPQSALIIEVPEAEPAVARHRERLDASAPLGIPAHFTVLYPFMPPAAISPPVLAELERLFAAVSRFRFRLEHTGWFGEDVLWLAPGNPAHRGARHCGQPDDRAIRRRTLGQGRHLQPGVTPSSARSPRPGRGGAST